MLFFLYFETYGIIVVVFLVIDLAKKGKFFKETFPMANISLDVIFLMFFLILNDVNNNFLKRNL